MEPTWLSGRVLSYTFQSDFYGRPIGQLFLPYPDLLMVLAYFTLTWELVGPLLLMSTIPGVRGFACLSFIIMHFHFGVFLRLGTFQFTPMLYMIGLLPAALWELRPAAAALRRLQSRMARWAAKLSPPPFRPVALGRKTQWGLSLLYLYVFLISLGQDPRVGRLIPERWEFIAHTTGLFQRWTVFVDTPNIFDGWLVVEATLKDGREVDLFQGYEPPRWGKPLTPYHRYTSFRWPTPLVVITGDSRYHKWFVRGLARDWKRDHPKDEVQFARILLFQEHPKLDYTKTTFERKVLWEGSPE
jgi:hypothetical protein